LCYTLHISEFFFYNYTIADFVTCGSLVVADEEQKTHIWESFFFYKCNDYVTIVQSHLTLENEKKKNKLATNV
jgi:hypothetical protein